MELKLIRKETAEGGVYGTIHLDGERDSYDVGTLENAETLIPEGRYPLRMTYSPKFGKMRPEICDVPERSGIRFHLGTRPHHSAGCVLVSPFGLGAIEAKINLNKKYEEETFITVCSA